MIKVLSETYQVHFWNVLANLAECTVHFLPTYQSLNSQSKNNLFGQLQKETLSKETTETAVLVRMCDWLLLCIMLSSRDCDWLMLKNNIKKHALTRQLIEVNWSYIDRIKKMCHNDEAMQYLIICHTTSTCLITDYFHPCPYFWFSRTSRHFTKPSTWY